MSSYKTSRLVVGSTIISSVLNMVIIVMTLIHHLQMQKSLKKIDLTNK